MSDEAFSSKMCLHVSCTQTLILASYVDFLSFSPKEMKSLPQKLIFESLYIYNPTPQILNILNKNSLKLKNLSFE